MLFQPNHYYHHGATKNKQVSMEINQICESIKSNEVHVSRLLQRNIRYTDVKLTSNKLSPFALEAIRIAKQIYVIGQVIDWHFSQCLHFPKSFPTLIHSCWFLVSFIPILPNYYCLILKRLQYTLAVAAGIEL